jgi:hypothetical protein
MQGGAKSEAMRVLSAIDGMAGVLARAGHADIKDRYR